MALKMKLVFFLFLIAACNGVDPVVPTTPQMTTYESASTATPPTEGSTSIANLTSTVQPETTAQPPSNPCEPNPCPHGIKCQARFTTFVCLCLGGDYYDGDLKECVSAKVFPGNLTLQNFMPGVNLTDKTSNQFQMAAQTIVEALDKEYKDSDGYKGSTVQEIQRIQTSRDLTRSEGVNVVAEITFAPTSSITLEVVKNVITEASKCDKCVFSNATFDATELCDKNPCDLRTSTCKAVNGSFTCNCGEGYITTAFSQRMCIACPSGHTKKEGLNECEPCMYGLLGFNCNEPWMLVTIVLGSLSGLLLLTIIIVVPLMASKSSKKKKSPKKNKNDANEKSFISQAPARPPMGNGAFANQNRQPSVLGGSAIGSASYANVGVPRIPRATTNDSWDNRSNLEMTPSGSRNNLAPVGRPTRPYEDSDDNMYNKPYQQTRPQSNPYTQNRQSQINPYVQSRPQANQYGQGRPQTNPYGQSQGQNNYGYSDDEGRRSNY